jgi:tetratricopeptide (TPR) repeat protein
MKDASRNMLAAKNKAQHIVWDAWDMPQKDAVALAEQALSIYPQCVDAYNVLGFHEKNLVKKMEYHKQAYDLFIESHDKAYFDKYTGIFGIETKTRPFMRAAFSYGDCLWKTGQRAEAVRIYIEMLRLCPNDNMGVRFILTSWLIISGDFAGARKIIKEYECFPANLSYGKFLLDMLENKTAAVVKKSFKNAFDVNAFIPDYILGVKTLPQKAPERCGIGDEAEAVTYMLDEYGKELWDAYPAAVKELAAFLHR